MNEPTAQQLFNYHSNALAEKEFQLEMNRDTMTEYEKGMIRRAIKFHDCMCRKYLHEMEERLHLNGY